MQPGDKTDLLRSKNIFRLQIIRQNFDICRFKDTPWPNHDSHSLSETPMKLNSTGLSNLDYTNQTILLEEGSKH